MSFKKTLSHRTVLLVGIVILLSLSPLLPLRSALAQEIPIVYEHFNTDLTLREDGVLHVRIIQQIRFEDTFSAAFYAIPIANVTSIANVQLYGAETESDNYELDTVDLVPITPNYVEDNGDEVMVDWNFESTNAGDVRLFVLEYDAFGVVWVYPARILYAGKLSMTIVLALR